MRIRTYHRLCPDCGAWVADRGDLPCTACGAARRVADGLRVRSLVLVLGAALVLVALVRIFGP